MVASGQIKVPARVELQSACKKVLFTAAKCFVSGLERTDTEVRVNGKVTTRVVFIDEFDGFNSEEHSDTWTEKFPHKGGNMSAMIPSVHLVETQTGKNTRTDGDFITAINVEHIIGVGVMGLIPADTQYVTDMRGNVEVKRDKMKMSTFDTVLSERFEIGETFTLDQSAEGVLGVDLNTAVRDIVCDDGRIVVKGVASACVSVVKTAEGGTGIHSNWYDWDFSKTFNIKTVGVNDTVAGSVLLSNVTVRVENREKPELVIEAELLFTGHTVVAREIEAVQDAFAYENDLNFTHTELHDVKASPSANVAAEVDGNVSMPDGSPFIGKVIMSTSPSVGALNVIALDGKVTIEGVLTTHIIYECEEKNIFSHTAQIPFSTACKIDGCTPEHNVAAAVTPLTCNVKARRGKELVVDARMQINVTAHTARPQRVAGDVTAGKSKTRDDSAITIHIAGQNESLWDIAKRTSIPTAEILVQNPNLGAGIKEGARIVIYRQEVINF